MTNKTGLLIGLGALAGGLVLLLRGRPAQAAPPLPSLAHLYGQVIDASTGQPVPGVIVDLSSIGQAATDSGGIYSFPSIPPGSYSVSFSKAGYQSATLMITVVVGNNQLDTQMTNQWEGFPYPPGTPIYDIDSQSLINIIYSRLPGSSSNYGNPTPVPLDQVPADVFPMAAILASRGTLPANLAWLLEPTIPSSPSPPDVTGGSLVKIISVVGETDSDGTPLPSSLVGTYWRANYPIAYGWFLLSRDGWMILLRRENFLLIDTSIYGPPGSAIPFTWFYAAGVLPPQ